MNRDKSETDQSLTTADARVAGWQAAVSLLAKSAEMQSRLVAFSPVELKNTWQNSGVKPEANSPLEELKILHLSQARPNRARVHSSWFRALEMKQVTPVRRALRRADEAGPGSLKRMMIEAAKCLSHERLVGDVEPGRNDSAVIRLLAGDRPMAWLRRLAWCGRLRRWVAGEANCIMQLPVYFNCNLSPDWPAMAREGLVELAGANKGVPPRCSKTGLITVGSLAAGLDSRRRQWLLQHLPMATGPLVAPFMRIGKPPMDFNRIVFEVWLAEAALQIESEGMAAFQARILKPTAEKLAIAAENDSENAIEPEAGDLSYETSDMDLFTGDDESGEAYSLLNEEARQESGLTESPDVEESGEIPGLKASHSGLFALDADDFVIEDSGEIEIQDIVIEDEEIDDAELEDSDSSFRIGDLEL